MDILRRIFLFGVTLGISYATFGQSTILVPYKNYLIPLAGNGCTVDQTALPSYGGVTAIVGKGRDINCYIANKISKAGNGDTVRLNYYIIEYLAETKYFYDAVKRAAQKGAKIELISERSQIAANGRGSPIRIQNQLLFLYGNGEDIDGVAQLSPQTSVSICEFGCRSTSGVGAGGPINHNKTTLLEINGQRNIIISTANVRKGGEVEWQAAIELDATHFGGHWQWWDEVFIAEKCLADGNSTQQCGAASQVGARSYESLGVTSYVPSPETQRIMPKEWLSKMTKPAGEKCSLKIAMGSARTNSTTTQIYGEMITIAEQGCDVDFIAGGNSSDLDAITAWFDAQSITPQARARISIEHRKDMHAKIILWDGLYNGLPKTYSWVGSMNFTSYAIKFNDETMLRVEGQPAFDIFSNHFTDIQNAVN